MRVNIEICTPILLCLRDKTYLSKKNKYNQVVIVISITSSIYYIGISKIFKLFCGHIHYVINMRHLYTWGEQL